LAIAPSPAEGVTVSRARVETALRRGGRQRRIARLAATVAAQLRTPQLRQDPVVEQAMRIETVAMLGVLNAVCDSVDQLAAALDEAFAQHPDYEIITSFPGLGDQSGARVLAEIGDDRGRFNDARALKAYAGAAPITRASGRSISISHRRIKNDRLAAAGFMWAFSASSREGGAKEHYRRRRDAHGDHHAAATRHLFNRLLGCLYHCLQTRENFHPDKAFPTAPPTAA
jgi:transposase